MIDPSGDSPVDAGVDSLGNFTVIVGLFFVREFAVESEPEMLDESADVFCQIRASPFDEPDKGRPDEHAVAVGRDTLCIVSIGDFHRRHDGKIGGLSNLRHPRLELFV